MDSKQVRETLQIIDLFWSIGLFIFFMYQKYMKKRCKFEVLYVTGVGSITDLVKIAFTDYTPGSITIKENEIEFNWSQYYGWLVTCPVLLIHLSNLAGTDVFDARRMMKILVSYQILMVSGATASMFEKQYLFKWVFFVMAVTNLLVVYRYAYQIFQESITVMPDKAKSTVIKIAFVFYVSWSGFGLTWFISQSGIGLISREVSKAAFAFFDIMSKNVYSMYGWYLRWYILRKHDKPEEFVNQDIINEDENTKQFSVILVESNAIYQHYLEQTLTQLNCNVTTVSEFNEILIETSKNKPDMLFINYDIASYSNFYIMFNIRKYLYMLPVISYGNNIDIQIVNNKHATGIDDFISAPFPNDVVKKKIVQWSRRASILPDFSNNINNIDSIEFKINELYKSINDIRQNYCNTN